MGPKVIATRRVEALSCVSFAVFMHLVLRASEIIPPPRATEAIFYIRFFESM